MIQKTHRIIRNQPPELDQPRWAPQQNSSEAFSHRSSLPGDTCLRFIAAGGNDAVKVLAFQLHIKNAAVWMADPGARNIQLRKAEASAVVDQVLRNGHLRHLALLIKCAPTTVTWKEQLPLLGGGEHGCGGLGI